MRGRGFLTGLLCWLQLRPASAASTARVVEPGEMDEVCQGDTIVLRCPPPSTVLFGDPSEIQWGRNGIWENKTACGKADVSDCNTTDVKESLSNHCQGKSECEIWHGDMVTSHCPKKKGSEKPRNYVTVKYSCINVTITSTTTTTTTTTTITTTTTTITEETMTTKIDKLSEELFDKLDGNLNEKTTSYVTDFFENAFDSMKNVEKGREPKTSILNITETISKKLMAMLNSQDNVTSLEIKTSQLTLKLLKKKFSESDETEEPETSWQSGGKEISLPDQRELLSGGGGDSLDIMMAAYDNFTLESASDVISVSTSTSESVNLSQPVIFLLPNNGDKTVSCAFYSHSEDVWSQDGCVTVCHNDSHTKCSCDHLTNFALIFNVHSEFIVQGYHANQLQYITYVGFSISIFSMILTIVVFLLQSKAHTTKRDVIHVNLCVSLLTAEVIFMFGITETSNSLYCSLISILLHYFFLASFAWMFLEGYQIYELLVKVFDTSRNSHLKHYAFGYFVPTVIVCLSLGIDYGLIYSNNDTEDMCFDPVKLSSYGTSDYCWLALANNFVLSFIIPAVMVIICNVAMLLFAVRTMMVNKRRAGSDTDLLITYMKGVGVLMCLLGGSWVTGLLLLAFNNLVIAYAFTILNSLQGVGIFVFQCLLNPQTRIVLKKMPAQLREICYRDHRKYQRTNTVEITDFAITSFEKDENQK